MSVTLETGFRFETGIMDTPNTGYIQRWYDMDVQLGELVRTLENLSEESQMLFAFLLTLFSDEIVKVKGLSFFREMEWEKLIGIYKSKKGRRWYDQDPVLHKAFNKLYSLNDQQKAAIAKELYIPGRLVSLYEAHCKAKTQELNLETICEIVGTCFTEGAEAAQQRYASF